MTETAEDIQIRVLENGREYRLMTHANAYRNLMFLIFNEIYPEGFGECKGMGRCGTCLVKILECQSKLDTIERNEGATLRKMGITEDSMRLSCQLLINEDLNGSRIQIV